MTGTRRNPEPEPDSALRKIPPFLRSRRLLSLALRITDSARIVKIYNVAFWIRSGDFMVLLWAAIRRLTSPGPGSFRQDRIGLDGRVFTCYMFRSMVVGAETGDIYARVKAESVVTLGRIMRKTRLDELPQLWSVLIGDTVFIGPRAEWTKCVAEYEHVIPYYHLRPLCPGQPRLPPPNYLPALNMA